MVISKCGQCESFVVETKEQWVLIVRSIGKLERDNRLS